jgi:hypothetical protein
MFMMFYGLPLIWVSTFQPNMVQPILSSAALGLGLIFAAYSAFWCATAVTNMIRDAVARAALDDIRDPLLDSKIERPRIVDLTSPSTLVVENMKQETREAIENLKRAVDDMSAKQPQETLKPAPDQVVIAQPVEKKKLAHRAKSAKKEG